MTHDRTELEKQTAHDRAQREKQMQHDVSERIRARQIEAADVFLEAAMRSQTSYTARTFPLGMSDEEREHYMDRRATDGLRYRNDAAAAVARLKLLFRADSKVAEEAQVLVSRLVALGQAVESTSRAFRAGDKSAHDEATSVSQDRLAAVVAWQNTFCQAVERVTARSEQP